MSAHISISPELPILIKEAVSHEIKTNWQNIKPELQDKLRDLLIMIAEERLVSVLTEDEQKRAFHERNIQHYEAALTHIKGIAKVKAYNSALNVIGRVLAGVLIATGKALI